jgi:DNA-binding NarL/FixJ family response regulator
MNILIANKYPLFRYGLLTLIKDLGADKVVEAGTLQQAKYAMEKDSFDLCLMDVMFGYRNTLEELSDIRILSPTSAFLIIVNDNYSYNPNKLHNYDIQGYISKSTSLTVFSKAIKSVLKGETWFPAQSKKVDDQPSELSKRQLEILRLVHMGLQNKNIANLLLISEGTVRIHLTDIYRILAVKNRTEAVHKAMDMGLLTVDC